MERSFSFDEFIPLIQMDISSSAFSPTCECLKEKMIDRDRTMDDVKKIIYELLCICAWQIHARLVPIARVMPLESHFSRQYTPFCLIDINLLENNQKRKANVRSTM